MPQCSYSVFQIYCILWPRVRYVIGLSGISKWVVLGTAFRGTTEYTAHFRIYSHSDHKTVICLETHWKWQIVFMLWEGAFVLKPDAITYTHRIFACKCLYVCHVNLSSWIGLMMCFSHCWRVCFAQGVVFWDNFVLHFQFDAVCEHIQGENRWGVRTLIKI